MSLLGIDLGTSGIKCVAYNIDGKPLARAYREHLLYTPELGVVELDPRIVWYNLKENIKELNSKEAIIKDPINSLSVSVSADEALPINKKGEILYNTIMSMDKRGREENNYINSIIGAEKVFKLTGQPPDSIYALNRLLWFKNYRKDIFKQIYKFLCWEEYIFYKLGSETVTDYSIASRTLAFDINSNKWSEEILNSVGIGMEIFPKVCSSGVAISEISSKLINDLGFKNRVKIITGGFDQCCAALGAGVTKKGMTSIGTGTMEVMQVCFDEPIINSKIMNEGYSFIPHVLKDLFICLTLNFNGGVIFKWYRDNLACDEKIKASELNMGIYDIIMDSANKSNYPVLFLPYFEGAQTPWKKPEATGSFFGLTLRTKREDIIRGIIEGITFDLRFNLDMMAEQGIDIKTIRATGGGARSETWLHFKADITGRVIQKLDIDEAGCMSAAVLAGYGSGEFNSIKHVIDSWVKVKKEYHPDLSKKSYYDDRYLKFVDVCKKVIDLKLNF